MGSLSRGRGSALVEENVCDGREGEVGSIRSKSLRYPNVYIRFHPLRVRQNQASMVRIEHGILLPWPFHINSNLHVFSLAPRRNMIDLLMHLCQKCRRGRCEPASAAELERSQVPTPVGGA
jgi:hypothetical protein